MDKIETEPFIALLNDYIKVSSYNSCYADEVYKDIKLFMKNYSMEQKIKAKLIAEKADLTDTKSCKIILGKCVMGERLIKQYNLIKETGT